jgi:hypothetical protein
VPRGGLPQVRSSRHGVLQGAWRGQALSAKRLHHGSSRQHAALLCAWRWQAVPDGGLLQGGSAPAGGTRHCIAHGGGKHCQEEGCTKSALGDTGHCVLHGGGRRCQKEGCLKAAQTGGTPHCQAHGGGRRVRRRAAQRQSRELPAVCTARCVSSASSPTMRRTMHRNSVARPRRPKPRVGSRSSCEILHRRRVESAGPPTG